MAVWPRFLFSAQSAARGGKERKRRTKGKKKKAREARKRDFDEVRIFQRGVLSRFHHKVNGLRSPCPPPARFPHKKKGLESRAPCANRRKLGFSSLQAQCSLVLSTRTSPPPLGEECPFLKREHGSSFQRRTHTVPYRITTTRRRNVDSDFLPM